MSGLQIKWYGMRILLLAYWYRSMAFLLRLPVPPKISAVAIIERENKYLVVNLTYRSGLALPGGLLEGNETLEEGVAREVKEETGLTVTHLEYLTSKTHWQYGVPVLGAAFVAQVTGELRSSTEGAPSWKSAEEILKQMAYVNSKAMFEFYLTQNQR